MSGYSGRLSVVGDATQVTEAILGIAFQHAEKQRNRMLTAGHSSAIQSYTLPGGIHCVVAELQHMRGIRFYVDPLMPEFAHEEELQKIPEYPSLGVHDAICGRVRSSIIIKEQFPVPDPKDPTKTVMEERDALNKLVVTDKTLERYTDLEARVKLGVIEHPVFAGNNGNDDRVFSEHAHVKPANYSGAMRKVVQLLLGVGYVVLPNAEKKWLKAHKKEVGLPDELTDIVTEKKSQGESAFGIYHRLPKKFTNQIPVRLTYQYDFWKTHGVCFDQQKKPWVIEISQAGVFLIPLYLDPISKTVEGRKRYLEVSPELTDFFEEFGGFPIGTQFPSGKVRDSWVRAGEAIKLLGSEDMAEFYSGKQPYGTDVGWCFNTKGTEARNTCWAYKGDLKEGYHYTIDLRLGNSVALVNSPAGKTLASMAASKGFHLVNKALRMSANDAADLLRLIGRDAEAGWKAFEDATVQPSLVAQANLSLSGKGKLYSPARFAYQPQIKFPEPILGGVVSFDFSAAEGFDKSKAVFCDTPMFVMFDGDNVETINYFYDPRAVPKPDSDDRQECQFVGTWKYSSGTGDASVYGNFYSNRHDWRESLRSRELKAVATSEEMGRYNYAQSVDIFSRCIWVTRYVVFHIHRDITITSGSSKALSVAVPMNDRCAYYMAAYKYIDSETNQTSDTTETVAANTAHQYELYNYAIHWASACQSAEHNSRCVAKLVGVITSPGCIDDAPDDMHYSVCPGNYKYGEVITVNAPWGPATIGSAAWPKLEYPNDSTFETTERKVSGKIVLVSGSGHGDIEVYNETKSGKDSEGLGGQVDFYSLNMSSWWFKASPDESGTVAKIYETHSCLGTNVMNYESDFGGSAKHIGSPEGMYGEAFDCYVGVIE